MTERGQRTDGRHTLRGPVSPPVVNILLPFHGVQVSFTSVLRCLRLCSSRSRLPFLPHACGHFLGDTASLTPEDPRRPCLARLPCPGGAPRTGCSAPGASATWAACRERRGGRETGARLRCPQWWRIGSPGRSGATVGPVCRFPSTETFTST